MKSQKNCVAKTTTNEGTFKKMENCLEPRFLGGASWTTWGETNNENGHEYWDDTEYLAIYKIDLLD